MLCKKYINSFLVMIVILVIFGAPVHAQGDDFVDTFDDPLLAGWEHSPNAEAANGILRIEPDGFALYAGEWSDMELNVVARRIGDGFVVVNFRVSEAGEYGLLIGTDQIILLRKGIPLTQAPMEPLPSEEWFFVQIISFEGDFEIILNGQPVLAAHDPDPLASGGIALGAREGAISEFEELTLVALGEISPPKGDFIVEQVLRYSDDMQNRNFDVMIANSDSGTYDVEDEGDGNLAARLTGTKELEMRQSAWPARTWEDYDLIVQTRQSGEGTVAFGFRWMTLHPAAPALTNRGYWLQNSGTEWRLSKEIQDNVIILYTVDSNAAVDEWFELEISIRSVGDGAQIKAFINSEILMDYTDPNGIPFGGIGFRTEGEGAELWLDDVQVIEYVDSRFTWSQTGGPQGAHDLGDIAIDPRDWKVIYAGGLDSDLFKSTDGGETWAMIGLPHKLWTNRFRTIELAPSNPDIVYVGAGGKHVSPLWRSDNGGDTWHWMNIDGFDESLAEADTFGISIDPTDSMHLFFSIASGLGVVPREFTGIYETKDGGETFTQSYGGAFIGPVELNPQNNQKILAGSLNASEDGFSILRSTDGGSTWKPSDSGMNGEDIRQILFHPDDPSYVFAVAYTLNPEAGSPIYRSTDGGVSWHNMASLATANLILATNHSSPKLLGFHVDGISVSTDKGATWSKMETDGCSAGITALGTDDPNVMVFSSSPQIMLSKDLGKTCRPMKLDGFLGHAVLGLAAAKFDPGVVYVESMSGVHKSIDYGETWEFLYSGLYAGIAVDPRDSNTVYIGAVEKNEILKSTDGGKTWEDVSGPIEFPGVATLAIDPNDSSIIFAGTGHGPQFGPGGGGLYKSTDGGMSWNKLTGIPDAAVTAVVISEGDSNYIAAAVMGFGVYISQDGGANFELRNQGMTTNPDGEAVSPNVWAVAVDPRDTNVMYAGTVEHSGYGAVGGFQAVYKTTDGGFHWDMLLGAETFSSPYQFLYFGAGVDALVINPIRPDEIFVGLHDPGIIFSENGGKDWRYVNHGLTPLMTHVYPYRMIISPDGEVLYATTCGRSVFRNMLNRSEDLVQEGQ